MAAGVFCTEAMWTLFLPRFDVVRQVPSGLLGDVRTVLADHGEHFDPPHRILDPAHGRRLAARPRHLRHDARHVGARARRRACRHPAR